MWPSLDRYNSAIHQPDRCFADPDLAAGWPARDRRGLPAPASGAFGCVYHMNGWNNASWAVKCFTREVPTSEWRYTEVSAYIRMHQSPHMVRCNYIVPRGIMVEGRWHPVLKMEWVDGLTLDRYVTRRLNSPADLEALAELWLQVVASLEDRQMAHGDLQHGNIMVDETGGRLSIKLVDYDGIYVPAFKGEEGEESGLRDYQHPRRTGQHFNEWMDNFAALVIYISLRAVSLRPDLWNRYNTGENLLFRREDFVAPAESSLFRELRTLGDARLAKLVDTLETASLNDDPSDVDFLSTLVGGKPSRRKTQRAGATTAAVTVVMPVPVVAPKPPVVAPKVAPPPEPAATEDEFSVPCPTCGVGNRSIARYCRGCGRSLPYTARPGNAPLPLMGVAVAPVRVCDWCGTTNPTDKQWCEGCGAYQAT